MMARKRDSFLITNGRALKRRGLSGYDVRVRLDGQTLTFRDERGRTVAVPAASVDRLRHFRMGGVQSVGGGEGTSTIYETKIWWEGGWTPILLVPFRGNDAYRAALSAFARHVVDAHGLDRIRLGPGYVTAIINLLLVGPFTLAFLVYVFYVAVEDGGWWWVSAIVILLVLGGLVGGNIVSRWPRRLKSLDRLEAELN